MRDGTLYWIWLAQKLGAGNRYLPYLMERYSDAFEVYRADSEELFDTEMPEALQEALSDKKLDEALAISDYCTRLRIGILTYKSELYPAGLRRLKDPPTVLYYRGRMPDLSKMVSISVVGTRTMSEYGKSAGYKIAYELASAGVCIVSGMALGVDSVAACAALEACNTTIAVLGSGVDVIYPKEHTTLYKKIIERGAVISEYPPTTRPEGRHFPQRNRIISGLGMGTIVIEGDMRSGALIRGRIFSPFPEILIRQMPAEQTHFCVTEPTLFLKRRTSLTATRFIMQTSLILQISLGQKHDRRSATRCCCGTVCILMQAGKKRPSLCAERP